MVAASKVYDNIGFAELGAYVIWLRGFRGLVVSTDPSMCGRWLLSDLVGMYVPTHLKSEQQGTCWRSTRSRRRRWRRA